MRGADALALGRLVGSFRDEGSQRAVVRCVYREHVLSGVELHCTALHRTTSSIPKPGPQLQTESTKEPQWIAFPSHIPRTQSSLHSSISFLVPLIYDMPVAPKSFVGALATFIGMSHRGQNHDILSNKLTVGSFTYTAYVARYEGNQIDAARTRWQDQMKRGNAAMSGGASLLGSTK